MELYFLRHGKAKDLGEPDVLDDFSRPLTDKGIAETESQATALHRLGMSAEIILTSPLIRAKQTAQIIAKGIAKKKQLVETELLSPGCDLAQLRKLIAQYSSCQSIMVVGHEPDFSTLVGELIGGASVEMKKGGLALITVDRSLRAGSGILQWLIPPKILVGK